MNKTFEAEKKYLTSLIKKTDPWDREQIVYQWYLIRDNKKSTKIKLIFDLTLAKIIYVKITKYFIEWGKSEKQVEYLDLASFFPSKLIGTSFVMKRRSIKGKIFIDRFIRSNNITNYLIEDEGDTAKDVEYFCDLIDVTNDRQYYNQNMCTSFEKEDADNLSFLLNCFNIV